jgi:hypothetical protein
MNKLILISCIFMIGCAADKVELSNDASVEMFEDIPIVQIQLNKIEPIQELFDPEIIDSKFPGNITLLECPTCNGPGCEEIDTRCHDTESNSVSYTCLPMEVLPNKSCWIADSSPKGNPTEWCCCNTGTCIPN